MNKEAQLPGGSHPREKERPGAVSQATELTAQPVGRESEISGVSGMARSWEEGWWTLWEDGSR